MKRILFLVLLLSIGFTSVFAQQKEKADKLYEQERYNEAAIIYENILQKGHNADVYYNLGNCYYRLEKPALAILYYERALLLSPSSADIRHNLEIARAKTTDKITPIGEIFIVEWYNSFANVLNVDEWGRVGVFSFFSLLLMFGIYLFSKKLLLRKIAFFVSLFSLLICVVSNLAAYHQKSRLNNRNTGIIMISPTNVKSTPSKNGTDVFVLHEGIKVKILDDSMKEWKEIIIDDGKQGWIETGNLTKI